MRGEGVDNEDCTVGDGVLVSVVGAVVKEEARIGIPVKSNLDRLVDEGISLSSFLHSSYTIGSEQKKGMKKKKKRKGGKDHEKLAEMKTGPKVGVIFHTGPLSLSPMTTMSKGLGGGLKIYLLTAMSYKFLSILRLLPFFFAILKIYYVIHRINSLWHYG